MCSSEYGLAQENNRANTGRRECRRADRSKPHTHTHTSGCHTHIWSFTTLFQWFSACGDKHAAALTSTESRLVSLDQRSSESSLNMSRLNSGTKQHLFSCVKGDVCLKITAVFKTAY